jgi:4-amino-4-deoxy-L-arabinose transferase-like glycosyltransferase
MNSTSQDNDINKLPAAIAPGLLVALIITVSLAGIANHDLWTPDEPREAAISLGMSRSGNLVIPELAGTPFVEKPPLFYIIASFFLMVFGNIIGNTPALRLVSASFGLGTLLFTYLLGKIYLDRRQALIASGILATMSGFVHVTHWLLVDNALMFFIIASIWAFAQAYELNRLPYLALAGILAACAFLTKGMIGPLIIFIAWLGLFIPWINKTGRRSHASGVVNRDTCPALRGAAALPLSESGNSVGRAWASGPAVSLKFLYATIGYHALGLIVAVSISAIWIIAFARQGGPDLFREWWWTNHFGRFSGQATNLGHISPWHYYLAVLPVYILPWIAPFIVALVKLFKKIYRRETLPDGMLLLAFWIIGTFLLFSISATKREIYLGVLLPACALLCAGFLKEQLTALDRTIFRLWLILLFAGTLFGVVTPFLAPELIQIAPVSFGWPQVTASAIIFIALLVVLDSRTPFLRRFLIATMMLYSTLLVIYCPLVDAHKSYGNAFRTAARAIDKCPGIRIGGWNLDETTVAGFYYYCGIKIPPIPDRATLESILAGRNDAFNGAVTLQKNDAPIGLPVEDNQVIFEGRMGKRRLLRVLSAPDWENKGRSQEKEGLPVRQGYGGQVSQ